MKRKRDSPQDHLSNLLDFCSDSQIKIDPRLHIDYDDDDAQGKSIGVFLSTKGNEDADDDIPPGTTVRIPKKSVLSVKSSNLTKYFGTDYEFAPYGLEAQLELALAVYLEDSKGSASPWHLYLKSLPEKTVDLPMFWTTKAIEEEEEGRDRDEDVQTALGWMTSSEIHRHLIPLNTVKEFFYDTVVSTMSDAATTTRKPSLHAYYRAFSLVSSRAFIVDAYHGLAMVPVADAFNHIRDNHVHLETEFDVCPDCGSLRQCIHDHDRDLPEPSSETEDEEEEEEEELYYTMTTTTYIPIDTHHPSKRRTEIFNTYGTHLSNAQLLNQYGFILDANEADFVEFDDEDVLRIVGMGIDEEEQRNRNWGEQAKSVHVDSESELVYASENAMDLRISSDGRVSLGIVVFVYVGLGHTEEEEECLLQRWIDALMHREGLEREGLIKLANVVISLCKARLNDITQVDVDTILDDIPPTHWRTRAVGMHIMAERSILCSCISSWEEYLLPT
ncbi:hypothetical protein PQX77_021552 [Marasmius sp. AFHP31]|nr:hypothetical protein PQX77_021552 [Marasmius sp. AFHP31]